MSKVQFNGYEFDSEHEAVCSALFERYEWKWEQPRHSMSGWVPDFRLKGQVSVYVECKGALKWDDIRHFPHFKKYEEAVKGSPHEVLLIPESPKRVKNENGFIANVLGLLFDGDIWSYAEVGRWSSRVGFCHCANSWKDRMSGENVNRSSGDGQQPNVEVDWLSAAHSVRGKKVTYFKAFKDSKIEEWGSE